MTQRSSDSPPNLREHGFDIAKHARMLDPQHAIPERLQLAVAPRISAPPRLVIAAIDFDDEPGRRSQEIDDALAHDDLPSEDDAKLAACKASP